MMKLLVVEDHALVREGLVRTLSLLDKDARVLEAPDCVSAFSLLEREGAADLALLDLALPGTDGLGCLVQLRRRFPEMPVVILSAYDDTHIVSKAMKAGASGFVPKTYSGEQLVAALQAVLAGQEYLPDKTASLAPSPPTLPLLPVGGKTDPAEFGLTGRQADVLALMSRGRSNRDIASELGLTEGTVKIHATAIFKALGVSSRAQAMVAVARYGIKL